VRGSDRSLPNRSRGDRCEDTDVAVVPVPAEVASKSETVFQVVVTEPLSAKIADGHAAAEMEKGGIDADRSTAGVQAAQLRKDLFFQPRCYMPLDDLKDGLRDLRPLLACRMSRNAVLRRFRRKIGRGRSPRLRKTRPPLRITMGTGFDARTFANPALHYAPPARTPIQLT
jgi:hypothetical protein